VAEGKQYQVLEDERPAWMPADRPNEDGIFLVQVNARKDGTLFKNMFYLKPIGLDDNEYIVGLQTQIDDENESEEIAVAHAACKVLDQNMCKVEALLAGKFWLYTSMRRQDAEPTGLVDDGVQPLIGA